MGSAARGAINDRLLDDFRQDAPDFVRPDTTIDHAANIMIAGGRSRLGVVDEGRPLGLLTLAEAIGTLCG